MAFRHPHRPAGPPPPISRRTIELPSRISRLTNDGSFCFHSARADSRGQSSLWAHHLQVKSSNNGASLSLPPPRCATRHAAPPRRSPLHLPLASRAATQKHTQSQAGARRRAASEAARALRYGVLRNMRRSLSLLALSSAAPPPRRPARHPLRQALMLVLAAGAAARGGRGGQRAGGAFAPLNRSLRLVTPCTARGVDACVHALLLLPLGNNADLLLLLSLSSFSHTSFSLFPIFCR